MTAAIAAAAAVRAKPMATITSVFKFSMFSVRSLVVASRSSGVKAAFLTESNLASSSSRAVFSSSTAELTAATSDSLAAVAFRESKLDCRSLLTSFSVSKAESKTAISVVVAVVAPRESKLFCVLSIAVFNESKANFRAVMFASMLSSLALSASISARMSSRVAGSASTVKEIDDTVAAETSDAIMSVTKILDNVLLCIFVSSI